jgi:signal transduction histidine kinase
MIKSGKSTEKMVEDSLDKSHELIIKLSIALNSVDKFTELQEQDDKIDKEDIPLSEIMNICSEEFKPKSQAKGLEYEQNVAENSDNIVLLSNKSLLVEIVTEITQNAIMYTAEGRVTMDASYSNDHVEIRIVDTGIGISARQLPNLFKAGFQTENHETRSTTGMGLGLYISKKIAERLDITIELNSEIEKGTKVTLSIPAKIVNQ